MKRVYMLIKGNVQGIGFRYFTSDLATSFNLSGWVKNRHDGSVELEAQGQESELDQFAAQLKKGPALARVTDIEIKDKPVKKDSSEFNITH
ncbi:acylphosphatase [Chitinispirillales bacterium ANBcel5]|uniref:acylphosphatase n=1 Tax=Cellulosispirillum alkaliphilum TaxID=3039283 RepID=UPI002A556BB2|nr:acylphosphatase [Chitinispirillales bacterium ANBcel5]